MALEQSAFDISERVAEAQTLLNDHVEGGRYTLDAVVALATSLMNEEGFLRAMFDVKYFPPDTPPPVTVAGN